MSKPKPKQPPPPRKPRLPRLLPMFDTMKAASESTKVPVDVFRADRAAGCPAFRGKIDFGEWLEWHFKKRARQGELPLAPPPHGAGASNRSELDKWKAARERSRWEKEQGLLLERAEVRTACQAALLALFNTLDRVLLNELPPELDGLRPVAARAKLDQALAAVKKGYRDALEKLLAEEEAAPEQQPEEPK